MSRLSILALATVLGLAPNDGRAAFIISDTFDIGSPPARGDDGADPLDIPYYFRDASRTSGSVGSGVFSITHSRIGADTNINQAVIGPFSGIAVTAVSLVNVGDSVTLSFNIKLAAVPTDGFFRFGLYNSNTSPVGNDNASSSSNDLGYLGNIQFANASTQALRKELGTNGNILTGTDIFVVSGSASTTVLNDTLNHLVTLSLVLSSPTNILGTVKLDGSTIAIGTDSTSLITDFDELAFAIAGVADSSISYSVDNVGVDFSPVPEPASVHAAALTGLAVGFMLRRGRRSTA